MPDLTGKQKRQLRALAHGLKPVVQMGQKGATDALKSKVKQELEVHELIKVNEVDVTNFEKEEIQNLLRQRLEFSF